MQRVRFNPVAALVGALGFVGVCAPSFAAVTIGFNEEIGASLRNTTAEVHTADYPGILLGEIFTINKNIHNQSNVNWHGLHIALKNCNLANHDANACTDSVDGDGVSFGEILDVNAWTAAVKVAVNGVDMANWSVARELGGASSHVDHLYFDFWNSGNGFKVNHDDTLMLTFGMSDNQPDQNVWRLAQNAIPEPGSAALVGLSLLALFGRKKIAPKS